MHPDKLLDWQLYHNPLDAWLTAGGILVGVFVVLMIARMLVKRRLSRAEATRSSADDFLLDLLHRTRHFFFFFVALWFALMPLELPKTQVDRLHDVATVAFLLQIAIWGNGLIGFWVGRFTQRRNGVDPASLTTVTALGYLARVVLWIVIVLVTLDQFNKNPTTLITGLGISGIAVALAVQNILGDLFGALSIVLDKPFLVGDAIAVDNLDGTVEHIGLKTTRLRSSSGEQIIFSNADLLKSRIRNYKRMYERRVVFVTRVTLETSAEQAERLLVVLREIVAAQPTVRFDRTHFRSYGDGALEFETVYYVLTADYLLFMNTQQAINLELLRRIKADGICLATPMRTLVMRPGDAPALSGVSAGPPRDE
jgi:small-conductance mechanosensitive channel